MANPLAYFDEQGIIKGLSRKTYSIVFPAGDLGQLDGLVYEDLNIKLNPDIGWSFSILMVVG